MVMATPVWHGTQAESFALVNAIARNCQCTFGVMGIRTSTCEPHRAMVEDQRWMNGLLFMRRNAAKLEVEEHGEIWSRHDLSADG